MKASAIVGAYWMRARRLTTLAALGLAAALAGCQQGHKVNYTPVDPSLRDQPLYFYPDADRHATPRAFILFLGNDVGFWEPHQDLSWRLSHDGYTVVGVDIKRYLAELPSGEPQRDSAFAADIGSFIARVRHEMHADSLPFIIGGHSFGAEVAFWIALHEPPPGLRGVLAMSPRASGHLFVTPEDLLNYEASGVGAWSTIAAAHDIAPDVRIAIIRGSHDKFRKHDAAFAAAGGKRLKVYDVPLASHSLKRLIIAGPIIARALDFLLAK